MIRIDDTALQALAAPGSADCRLLIVSADPERRLRLSRLALLAAFEPRIAETPDEAYAWLAIEHCHVVVVDAAAGAAERLCGELRRSARERYVYVLQLLAPGDRATEAFHAGADDCLESEAPDCELVARLEPARRIAALDEALAATRAVADRLTHVDPLTGAYNRAHLERQLPRELERARRYVRPLSLVCFDVDRLEVLNTRYGVEAGDRVLRAVARAVRRRLRRGVDWLARSDGGEFVLVLPETGLDGARIVAERLRTAIAGEAVVAPGTEETVPVTASFGIAAVEQLADVTTAGCERLLDRARASLRRSKQAGRNRVTAHTPPGVLEAPAQPVTATR